MKSFIFSIILISILVVVLSPFYCSDNDSQLINTYSPVQTDTIKYPKDDDLLPCCNDNNPLTTKICGDTSFNPNALVSFRCDSGSQTLIITCECCRVIWGIYGEKPSYNIPCSEIEQICLSIGEYK